MPKIGNLVETDAGTGKVIDIDVFKKTCKVELPNKSVIVINVEDNNGKANDVLGYDLKIYQNDEWFCFSLDSVLLANFPKIKSKTKKY